MAEPDDFHSLPTQAWSTPDEGAPPTPPRLSDSAIDGMLGVDSPVTRRGWQPPTAEELQARLPQYEIAELLGRGGMGAVYKGWQKSLERFVAIKILPPGVESGDLDFAARFKREAKAMARLKHPGIIPVHDAGETSDGLLYFVMDFVDGTDLQKMLAARGKLPPEEALPITARILDALANAHQHGIIHRDIKPANVMIDREGQVLVADFGLARSTAANTSMLTGSNMAMGTPDLMAPESHLGMNAVDHRADLYAVGVVLYLMLTGKLPRGRFDPPSRAVPGLNKRLDGIVDRALQAERDARYSSAIELRTAFEPVLARTAAKRLVVAGRASSSWKKAALLVAAGLALVGGLAVALLSRRPQPAPLEHVAGSHPATTVPPAIVSIPGLPDLPPLSVPPGEPGVVRQFERRGPFMHQYNLLPDSRRLLACYDRAIITLLDLETENPLWSVPAGVVKGADLSADGSRFATCELVGPDGKPVNGVASSAEQAVIALRRITDGTIIQQWTVRVGLKGTSHELIALAPSGKRMVAKVTTASNSSTFVAFEEEKDQPVAEWTAVGHNGHVLHALDDDRFLSTGNGAAVILRISQPGVIETPFRELAELRSALSPDKRWLVAHDRNATAPALWDLETRQRVRYFDNPIQIAQVSFIGNDLVLATGDSRDPLLKRHLDVWDRRTGVRLATFRPSQPDQYFSDNRLETAANGTFCVVRIKREPAPEGDAPNTLQIWRLPKPSPAP